MSDMSRLEAKVERLTDQLASKERELQAITSKVFFNIHLGDVYKSYSCSQVTQTFPWQMVFDLQIYGINE